MGRKSSLTGRHKSEQTSHKNGTRKGKLTEGNLTDSVEKKNMEMVKFTLSPF